MLEGHRLVDRLDDRLRRLSSSEEERAENLAISTCELGESLGGKESVDTTGHGFALQQLAHFMLKTGLLS
jgi:hypothetical protein